MSWEINFLKYIIDNIHNDVITSIMSVITASGNNGLIWILIAVIFITFKKTRKIGITMSLSLVIIFITVNVIIKPFIGRARPFEVNTHILNNMLIELPGDSSFPSGHTAAAFAAATAVFCCNRKYGVFLLAPAFLMGLSRLYFAVHFPTDVIGGVIIGTAVGIISYKISVNFFKKYKK